MSRETIENTLEALEAIREEIIQVEATKANKAVLDASYLSVVEAIENLSKLRGKS